MRNAKELAPYLDFTLLRPEAIQHDFVQLCATARAYGHKAVCVPPVWVKLAAEALAGSGVAVCTVVGFPLGYNTPGIKLKEAEEALAHGATEIDLVLNRGLLLGGELPALRLELAEVRAATRRPGAILKVIIESSELSAEQLELACALCTEADVDFVKTSTGFVGAGAQLADVQRMRQMLPAHIAIKASGGIRTPEQAWALIDAGAGRIGASRNLCDL